jgi:hypothetical protein
MPYSQPNGGSLLSDWNGSQLLGSVFFVQIHSLLLEIITSYVYAHVIYAATLMDLKNYIGHTFGFAKLRVEMHPQSTEIKTPNIRLPSMLALTMDLRPLAGQLHRCGSDPPSNSPRFLLE